MMNDLFPKRQKRHIQDLNIVPILDMLTTVIFFLLMSTSFIEYTKLTVPPSAVSRVVAQEKEAPLSPKLLLVGNDQRVRIALRWAGKTPGEIAKVLSDPDPARLRLKIIDTVREISKKFASEHASQKTIQVGLSGGLPYQNLISLMDGVRENLPDIVLISYAEAEALGSGQQTEETADSES